MKSYSPYLNAIVSGLAQKNFIPQDKNEPFVLVQNEPSHNANSGESE